MKKEWLFKIILITVGIVLAGSTFSQTPTEGLIAHYPLDCDARDTSGFGNNGVIFNAQKTIDRCGVPDRAYSFNGVDQYIRVAGIAADPVGGTGFTVSAWAKPTDLIYGNANRVRPIIFKRKHIGLPFAPQFSLVFDGRNGNNVASYWVGSTNTIPGESPDSGRSFVETFINSILLNEWVHITGVYDDALKTLNIYQNGNFITSSSVPSLTSSSSPHDIEIGKSSVEDFFQGDIDNVRIYNRALSDQDILAIYNNEQVCTNSDAPIFTSSINTQQVSEGEAIAFTVVAEDPNCDQVVLSVNTLPSGAVFDDQTGLFTWVPGSSDAGAYTVTFTATDDGSPALSNQISVDIIVEDTNDAPTLVGIGPQTVNEGELLEFVVVATDPNGDDLHYGVSYLPVGALFDESAGTFSWIPDFDAAGSYNVLFSVNDGQVPPLSASESVTITVGNVNRPPQIEAISPITADEGTLIEFEIFATDLDGDLLTFQAGNIPEGASFDPQTRIFSWPLGFDQEGNYEVLFGVTDQTDSASLSVAITVGNVNRPPVLNEIGAKSGVESEELRFTVSGFDPDGDGLLFEVNELPENASFNPVTQVFSWTPDFDQAGNYDNIEFVLADDGDPVSIDMETITITIGDTNRAPTINPVGNQQVSVGELVEFSVIADDLDGDNVTLSANNLPEGASFNSTSGLFSWIPNQNQEGNNIVEFTATDDGQPSLQSTSQVLISVATALTPRQRIKHIIAEVRALGLPKQLQRKMVKKLKKARKKLAKDKVNKAISKLEKFIHIVEYAKNSGKLSNSEAEELINAANNVIVSIS